MSALLGTSPYKYCHTKLNFNRQNGTITPHLFQERQQEQQPHRFVSWRKRHFACVFGSLAPFKKTHRERAENNSLRKLKTSTFT
jgi:hypothetical protein